MKNAPLIWQPVKTLALMAACLLPLPSVAADTEAVTTLVQYMQSNYATGACEKQDDQLLAKFRAKFVGVYRQAIQEMKEINPERTDQEHAAKAKQLAISIKKGVDDLIRRKGCEDTRVQDMIAQFNELAAK